MVTSKINNNGSVMFMGVLGVGIFTGIDDWQLHHIALVIVVVDLLHFIRFQGNYFK